MKSSRPSLSLFSPFLHFFICQPSRSILYLPLPCVPLSYLPYLPRPFRSSLYSSFPLNLLLSAQPSPSLPIHFILFPLPSLFSAVTLLLFLSFSLFFPFSPLSLHFFLSFPSSWVDDFFPPPGGGETKLTFICTKFISVNLNMLSL